MGKSRQAANLVSNNQITVDTINQRVGIGSTVPTTSLDVIGNQYVSGIVTATSFRGDGSQLTGVSASGGTPTYGGDTPIGLLESMLFS